MSQTIRLFTLGIALLVMVTLVSAQSPNITSGVDRLGAVCSGATGIDCATRSDLPCRGYWESQLQGL